MNFKHVLAAAGVALAALAVSTAQAHATLQAAEPRADSQLDTAPKQIRLQFSDTLEPEFSKIRLIDAANKAIELPTSVVDKANPAALAAPVPALKSGQYRVQWSTVTRDGHKVKGEYSFKVK